MKDWRHKVFVIAGLSYSTGNLSLLVTTAAAP